MRTRRGALASAGLVFTSMLVVVPARPVAAATASVSFDTTGSTVEFTAPRGVSEVVVTAIGGDGGNGTSGGLGGLGAKVTGTMPVAPGARYRATIGRDGADGVEGGGAGGSATTISCIASCPSGMPINSVVAVAGGGGGGGASASGSGGDGGDADADGADGTYAQSRGLQGGAGGLADPTCSSCAGGTATASVAGDGGDASSTYGGATGYDGGGDGGDGLGGGGGGGEGSASGATGTHGGGGGADPTGTGGGGAGGTSSTAWLTAATRDVSALSEAPSLVITWDDTVAPEVAITSPANSTTHGSVTAIAGTVSNGLGDPAAVSVSIEASDGSSTSTTATVVAGAWQVPLSPGLTDGTYTVKANASDAAGNAANEHAVTFTVDSTPTSPDTTPPVITATPSGSTGTNGWYTSAVSVLFSATDEAGGSGITAASCPANGSTSSSGTVEGSNVTVSAPACADLAGNPAAPFSAGPYKVDLSNPAISGAAGTVSGDTATVSLSATDGVSGIAGVTIDGVAASAAGSTFTAAIPVGCGAHSAAVIATDHAGRTASTTVALERACAGFSAVFAPPIDVDEVNLAKQRRTIPVKVEVFAPDGSEDRVGPLTLGVSPSDCVPRVEMDSVETYTTASTTGTAFRWSADGDHWIYNLSVSSLTGAAPDKCYRADVVRNGVVVGSFELRITK